MKLIDAFNANQPFVSENQQHNHFQMLLIFKSFFAMLAGEQTLESVDEMSAALIETPAFDLAAQHLKCNPACAVGSPELAVIFLSN